MSKLDWFNFIVSSISYFLLNYIGFSLAYRAGIFTIIEPVNISLISTGVFLLCRLPYSLYVNQLKRKQDAMIENAEKRGKDAELDPYDEWEE